MGNFGLNGGVPWLRNTDEAFCSICKTEVEDLNHFVVNFQTLKTSLSLFGLIWKPKLSVRIPQTGEQLQSLSETSEIRRSYRCC